MATANSNGRSCGVLSPVRVKPAQAEILNPELERERERERED
jgi:hypothetical protein